MNLVCDNERKNKRKNMMCPLQHSNPRLRYLSPKKINNLVERFLPYDTRAILTNVFVTLWCISHSFSNWSCAHRSSGCGALSRLTTNVQVHVDASSLCNNQSFGNHSNICYTVFSILNQMQRKHILVYITDLKRSLKKCIIRLIIREWIHWFDLTKSKSLIHIWKYTQ